MSKFCIYSDTHKDAPCISLKLRKYSYLPDFLQDKPKSLAYQGHSIPVLIDCIKFSEEKLQIKEQNCINCMFCAFGCIGNKVLISNFHPKELCADITRDQVETLKSEIFPKLFKGEFIRIPQVPFSHLRVQFKSFEDFTAIKETKHIAVWGANAMKFLSTSLEPRVALEVGVDIAERDRAGRLDISLMNTRDNYLFVAEAKVSFEAMMGEFRFESQMLGYESVLSKSCAPDIRRCKFLLIGGRESDLLPKSNSNCTSGNKADLFYDVLRNRHFFFISANAMLALGLMKMFVSQGTYNLENLYEIIISNDYLGILSSGVVAKNGDIIPLDKIIDFIKD